VGGIAPAELAAIRGRLEAFVDDILESLPRTDQRARGACYVRGLMLEGRRKSVEPMAQRLGDVHYQALHHFVAVSPWDWRPVRRRLAERLVAALGPPVWAVDDTGFPRTVSVRWGWSASTRARWARQPTGSWACRSTPSPSRPAARWTGGCLCPGAGTRDLGWTTSRAAASAAGTTTSPWSRSPTAISPWSGCAARNGGVGRPLWLLLGELQALLTCWAGACPLCKRPAPRWLCHRGRASADLTEPY